MVKLYTKASYYDFFLNNDNDSIMNSNRASDYKNPFAFPLLAKNLSGLPQMYIVAMGLDPLKDDSIKLADRLQQHGQEYYLTIWPGVSHGALSLIPITPEIQKYLDAMTTYLRVVLPQS